MKIQTANTCRVLSMGQAPLHVLTHIGSFNDHSSYWLLILQMRNLGTGRGGSLPQLRGRYKPGSVAQAGP